MHRIILLLVAVSVAFAESGVGSSGSGTGGGGSEGGGGAAPQPAAGSGNWIFIAFFVLMGFMLWSTFRSQKKEKQKQQQLIANLTIGNRVETIGGLRGEVVRKGEGEIDIRSGDSVFTIALGAVKQLAADGADAKKE
jgi:preprotein translocase subunit YajC